MDIEVKMVNSEQNSMDKKTGITLAIGILTVPIMMLSMVVYGIATSPNELVQSKPVTVVTKYSLFNRTVLLLSDDGVYNTSRAFSFHLEHGDELTLNLYQNNREELCILDKCE
ncbi:hypothetical protein BCT32_10380 [Vibrio sp. 10N.261.45.E11]|nr:hypothetical protein BCT34_03005 [Vibrio sp. 10N.261.45.E2]PMN47386.1 hypothetical protein BCT32_10380 [Vibrio sp. 10N.261.45.E11]